MNRCLVKRALLCFAIIFSGQYSVYAFESPPASPAPTISKPGARAWDLSIRLYGGYTDNAQIINDTPVFYTGSTDAWYGGAQINGTYRFINDETWLLGAAAAFETIHYSGHQEARYQPSTDDANDFDLQAFTPSVFARRRFTMFELPASVGLRYKFRWDESAEMTSTKGHYHDLDADLTVALMPQLEATLAYTHGWDEFDVTFPATPSLNERDANRDAISLGGKYYFDRRKRNVQLVYIFSNNDSEGSNFAYEAHGLKLRGESHLIGPLWGAVEFNYQFADYNGFVSPAVPPPGREDLNIFTYKAQLIYVIDKNWSVDVYYNFQDIQADSSIFSSQIMHVGSGITFKF